MDILVGRPLALSVAENSKMAESSSNAGVR